MPLSRNDFANLLRSVGGVLLATGATVLFVRKSSHQTWSDLALLLVVLTPAVVLYALALGRFEHTGTATAAEPWRSILMVASLLLAPVALFRLLDVLGASSRHLLYDAAVFALVSLMGAFAARRARIPYAVLLAALSMLIAWLLLWAKLLGHPSADTVRWLLVAGAASLSLASFSLVRAGGIGAGELATAAGVAAIAAGMLGVAVGTFAGFFVGPSPLRHLARPPATGLQSTGWDLYLLAVSLTLVCVGARARSRGMGYVGSVGLLAFVISVGTEITRVEAGRPPNADVTGWPLALLALGIVALCVPVSRRRSPEA